LEPIRGIVGRPRTPLVFTVLGHEQPALQGMIVRREPNAVWIPVPPREGLDRVLRVLGVDLRSQDRAVTDTRARCRVEGRDSSPRTLDAMGEYPLVATVALEANTLALSTMF